MLAIRLQLMALWVYIVCIKPTIYDFPIQTGAKFQLIFMRSKVLHDFLVDFIVLNTETIAEYKGREFMK